MRRVLRLDEPIDLGLTLGVARRGAGDPTFRVDETSVWRATRTPQGPATVRFAPTSDGVVVEAWGAGAEHALHHAPAMIGAHDDPSSFDPPRGIVRDLHRRIRGLRLGASRAVMESLVPSILEQKVTGREAWSAFRALVGRYGERAPGPGDLWLQPTPERIAGLPYWAFHPLGVEQRRADTVRHVCARASRLEQCVVLSREAAYRRLQAIPGVGPWTAAEVAKVALGDPDAVSVGDFHLKNVVAWALAGEPRATDERMLELLEPYAGHRQRAIRLIEASAIRPPKYGPRMPVRSIAGW